MKLDPRLAEILGRQPKEEQTLAEKRARQNDVAARLRGKITPAVPDSVILEDRTVPGAVADLRARLYVPPPGPDVVDGAPWVPRAHGRETTYQHDLTGPAEVEIRLRSPAQTRAELFPNAG